MLAGSARAKSYVSCGSGSGSGSTQLQEFDHISVLDPELVGAAFILVGWAQIIGGRRTKMAPKMEKTKVKKVSVSRR
jgi:hypothetical protein